MHIGAHANVVLTSHTTPPPARAQKNAIAALTATIESSNEAVGVALKSGVVRSFPWSAAGRLL